MNKFDLICELAKQQRLSRCDSAKIVDLVFNQIADALACRQRVEIRGLWTFKTKGYRGYMGRNPRSGESVFIEPKMMPIFRPCSELKKRVDSGRNLDP